jgi:hypothetical protein
MGQIGDLRKNGGGGIWPHPVELRLGRLAEPRAVNSKQNFITPFHAASFNRGERQVSKKQISCTIRSDLSDIYFVSVSVSASVSGIAECWRLAAAQSQVRSSTLAAFSRSASGTIARNASEISAIRENGREIHTGGSGRNGRNIPALV